LALKEGGKGRKAVIAGMNRIGPRWCGGSSGLLTGVLRSEWGFDGFVMTDVILDGTENYCDILEGLEAGTDVWQNTSSARYSVRGAQLTYGVRARFRTAAGRVLKSLLYSNVMNGMGEETTLSYSTAPWKYWRMAIDAVLMLLAFLCGWYALAQFLRARRLSAKISELERERKRKERQRRSGMTA
ncbi:MAG: glycoside hydrolase family 3 N-terminal domain-containing protein, partial [Eubacteriales bacterium]|nr:glycoside hydrolase family 3 N-terminal domain-containing protein [Eubacteriales bacterium]